MKKKYSSTRKIPSRESFVRVAVSLRMLLIMTRRTALFGSSSLYTIVYVRYTGGKMREKD